MPVISKRTRHDLYVYIALLALGALQLALSPNTFEFPYDSYYYELARSILAKTGYGFNFRPEPMIPPGFPALLALFILLVGQSYAVLIRSMAFFTTAGLIAAYELLKIKEGRPMAAVSCILLASSPSLFVFSTRMLFSDMPYFFTSMLLLWVLAHCDCAGKRTRTQALWWIVCFVFLEASILIRSTGIALAGGIFGWLTVALFRKRTFDKSRLAFFVPLIVLAVCTEVGWLLWSEQHPVSHWPVHGFQESYVTQLKLKNGNNPELGLASWQDVLKRPLENEDDMATSMVELFTHKAVAPAWYSPTTVIPLLLLLLGLVSSFRQTGGHVTEYYFVTYQFLYLFWPWNFELRFQLPVAPLAALYVWRGGVLFWRWARTMPHLSATACLLMAALGILSTTVWGLRIPHPAALPCVMIWFLVSIPWIAVLVAGPNLLQKLSVLCNTNVSLRGLSMSGLAIAGGVAMTCLVAAGVWRQAVEGWDNIHRVPEMDPRIEAARWIGEHSPADAVVMSRWEALVYHYSGRKVIWFPASTDPQLLMAGVYRHHIRYIVVTEDEDNSYWKPSDTQCLRALMRFYPAQFHEVHEGAHEQIYEYQLKLRPGDAPTT